MVVLVGCPLMVILSLWFCRSSVLPVFGGAVLMLSVVIGVEPETAVISAVLFVLYLAGLKLSYELRSYGCYLDAIRI